MGRYVEYLHKLEPGDIVYWNTSGFSRPKEVKVLKVRTRGKVTEITTEPIKCYGRTYAGYYKADIATGAYGAFISLFKYNEEFVNKVHDHSDEWVAMRAEDMNAIAALKCLRNFLKSEIQEKR